MNPLQEKLFDLALEYKHICETYNLRYFLAYGTLLGSIRHNGFIPWDDDLDFCMPRDDYQKFLQIAPSILKEKYILRNFEQEGESFCLMFSQLHDINTTFLVEKYPSGYQLNGGLLLDIFPLDGTFSNAFLRKKHLCLLRFLQKLRNLSFSVDLQKDRHWIKKSILYLVHFSCRGKIMYKLINFISKLKNYDNSQYVGDFCSGVYQEKQVLKREVYEEAKESFFENEVFKIPNNADFYLRQFYGDYQTLPPEQQRKGHAVFFDLNKSYMIEE